MAITRPLFWRGIPLMQFFLVEDEDGMWGWQLKSGDDTVAVSTLRYADIQAVQRAVEEVRKGVGAAELPDEA